MPMLITFSSREGKTTRCVGTQKTIDEARREVVEAVEISEEYAQKLRNEPTLLNP